MLTILDRQSSGSFCDRVTRRGLLRIGGLAMGGLTLPNLLRAEAKAGIRNSNKSIILINLPGGAPHIDMYDLKMDAPMEVRGEFKPIDTAVPGIQFSEWLPMLSKVTDRMAVLRSIVGSTGEHSDFQCMTGKSHKLQPAGGWPVFGAVTSHKLGSTSPAVPAYVDLGMKLSQDYYPPGGFLGPAAAAFSPNGEGKDDLVLNGITLDRLADRKRLIQSLDNFNRQADGSQMMAGFDTFQQQALGVLQSSKLAEALDLSKEDPRTIARYGPGGLMKTPQAPYANQWLLKARRLVEAGVRVVSLSYGYWDWHGENLRRFRETFPYFDQGVSALVEDLYDRGLDKDVTVLVWGEFGRSPKINSGAGRDHWPQVNSALMFGGGMRVGQVIGSTDSIGGEVKDRPIPWQDVFATLYKNIGINHEGLLHDQDGRPQFIVENGSPIAELY
ncbi:MAG: DUF1501 domain-containing protein [Planctomycetota bacterium]|nr:DUF1501 domain-containing protein [Planctomycetota bacterium]